ncbi:hypothetical protein [Flavihumibacter sp. UBA7668]|uniref:hypothetical protein n=1 Tax=Flavihumibacter sp. UBA7668 TaxID=1946542 RepID=UPI0025B831C3|nr:hypothetical protein [Flavihumibacter sp. UBA7668]
MRLPLQQGLREFFGLCLLLILPLAGSFAGKKSNEGVFNQSTNYSIVEDDADGLVGEITFSALRFEFGNWIPEAIRTVTIRMTNLAPSVGGLDIFIKFIPVRIAFPLHQPDDFSVKPDFVGFLFRLKPF